MLHSPGRTISHRARFIALLSATAFVAPSFAQSLPTGGTVSTGNAVIGGETNGAITISQGSANAVINWQSFNIGAGNAVNFVQPDASSAILNRVTGLTTTSIAGQLKANGQVYLINPNGITITPTGTVNTGAFVASSLGISDDAFMTGGRTFTGNGASAAVSNAGTITIARGGYLALIGGSVANSGTITVPMGKAALGSGEQATLDLSGDGFLQVAIPTNGQGSDALVSNSGTISANGGMVQLSAAAARDMARQAINMSGTIEARGVSGRSGDITLFGGEGEVVVTGQVVVRNTEGKGGSVTVASREIELATALIDASGTTGGGTVHIGGERRGGGTLPHAQTLSVDAGTTINADATSSGNGGDVVLWSDSLTRFAGTISAKGGAVAGNGGQVEVSGRARLAYTGFADLSAANGAFGDLLLDPYNVIISSGADTGGFTASGDDSVINAATLVAALSGANVTVSTGSSGTQAGDITVASALTWNSGSLLTLSAAGSIAINAPITVAGGGQVAFNFSTANTLTGGLAFATGSALTFTDGAHQGAQALTINGNAFTLLRSLSDVEILTGQNFGEGYFALARDLDASGRTYNDALIGNTQSDTFYGTLEGLGHVISNLTIVSRVSAPIGLIGRLGRYGTAGNGTDGVVRNIGLVGGSVTAGGIGFESPEGTGGLVGANNGGTIINAYNTGTVSGEFRVGGLVGVNTDGRIISSYATGAVSAVAGPNAHDSIGGLVGLNIADAIHNSNLITVTNSYATGTVSGGSHVGGLIGGSGVGYGGVVTDVYATGAVHGTGNYVGGLTGFHSGKLTNAYATGAVSGADYVGGVAGRYDGNSAFSTDFLYATGAVSGRTFVGGLIGYNTSGLRGAYATGAVTGAGDNVGGLIGTNVAVLETVYATGAVSSTGNNVGGLAGENGGTLTVGYATGEVRGADSVGGLVGFHYGRLTNAYATGAVTGANHVGGLVGLGFWAQQGIDGRVTNAYATGAVSGNTNTGGLVGFALSGTTSNAYWDTQTTGQSTSSGGGTGLTTAQIQNPFTFIDGGWNFAGVWGMPRAGGAPVLRSLTANPVYSNYVRLSGNTSTTYGAIIGTSGITLGGIGAGNVSVGWGSAISASTNAGTYAYGADNVLALTYSAGVAGDYYVDYAAGALTIGQRAVTVTANALSRTYGDANPALTYAATGLINGDTLSGSLATSATATSNVGAYGITQGSLANGNYAVTYAGAELTVDQRAVTISANDASRRYGAANPIFSYAIGGAGLVNGDRLIGDLATVAGDQSEPGAYAITQGSLLASSNYNLSFREGVMTVEMAANPGPGTMASVNATAHGKGPFLPFYTAFTQAPDGSDGSRVLIADPRFKDTVVCLDHGAACTTLPTDPQL